jgi:predicted DNA-binding transcriptional regulator YafY
MPSNPRLVEALFRLLPYVEDENNEAKAASAGISMSDLLARLAAEFDPKPNERTVRRALAGMSELVSHIGHTRGARWFKTSANPLLRDERTMSANLAIALCALNRVAARQLPAVVLADLQPYFERATATLALERNNERAKRGRSWASKTLRIDSTQPVLPPPVDAGVYQAVTQGLLYDLKLSFRNRPAGQTEPGERVYRMSPLALVDRAGVLYLIAWGPDSPGNQFMFRMDRLSDVRVSDEPADQDPAFDLTKYVETESKFHFMPEPEVELKLRVYESVNGEQGRRSSHMLREFRLSSDQGPVEEGENHSFVLTARVKPSVMLRQFLHSHSDSIEILAPQSLRDEFAQRARNLLKRYDDAGVAR